MKGQPMKIEFSIDRDGTLIDDGEIVDRFASVTIAADMAIRFAQDQDRLYSIRYPN